MTIRHDIENYLRMYTVAIEGTDVRVTNMVIERFIEFLKEREHYAVEHLIEDLRSDK